MDHIVKLETTFTKLNNVGQTLNELIKMVTLILFIKNYSVYEAFVAAIRTMDEDKISWGAFTTRPVDEY